LSSTKSLILLFIGLPGIQILRIVKCDIQKEMKSGIVFVFVGNVGEALEEVFGKDVVED